MRDLNQAKTAWLEKLKQTFGVGKWTSHARLGSMHLTRHVVDVELAVV